MDKVTFGRKRKLDDCPNRLFLSYLQVWRDEAKQKESKAYHTYNKAFKTLSKYPLPLQNGKEAMILENFGNKICSMLDAKLEKESQAKGLSPHEYLEESRDVSKNWWYECYSAPSDSNRNSYRWDFDFKITCIMSLV